MSIADRGQPVEVNVGDCRCPGSPHALDTVWLKPELDVPLAIAANAAIRSIEVGELSAGEANAEVQYVLTGVYLRHSIVRWTFTDEKGLDIPITPSNVARLLPWGNGGGEVVEAADNLYSEKLFAPLVAAMAVLEKAQEEARPPTRKSSGNGRTASPTSATPSSGDTPPEPSSPSSPTSSAGQPSMP